MTDPQRRLEYLLAAISAITYTAAPQGGATFMSANVRDVLGWDPEQFYRDRAFWMAHIHPEDRPSVVADLRALEQAGELAWVYRFEHRDGSYRWMRDVCRLLRDEDGAPLEIVGYWIDITEQHRAEASLRRSEANFRALIERSPAAIYVHRAGRHVYVNPAGVALFGYASADEMIGRSVLDFIHPDDRALVGTRMAQVASGRDTSIVEIRTMRRDGTVAVIESEAMLLHFDGEPSTVVLARDVTQGRELFARMAMADRMLTVGSLAAGVAHEINNPLAYITSSLEVLAQEVPALLAGEAPRLTADELRGLLADAREGIERVTAVVRDLRALSRPEDEARGPVDVAAVLASSIKMAHNEIRHRARVLQELAPDLPPVHAHASRLGQVFLNLLLNAAQAIGEGKADRNEIRVRARAAPSGDRVVIEIEDTGSGIPSAILRRIFDPFFTTKAPGSGIGLGLSISHELVRAMNGEITVESTPGAGSTFRVALPVSTEVPAPVASRPRATTERARILVIDDEPALGRALGALLSPAHEVVVLARAQEAAERLAGGEAFDVILCDLMMPEMTGMELYERISEANRRRMIFMTGGAFTEQARQFLASLECPRLEKPFGEAELAEAIDRVVRGDQAPPPAW